MDKLKQLFDSFYLKAGAFLAMLGGLYDALPGLFDQLMNTGSGIMASVAAAWLAIKGAIDKFGRGKE